MKKDAALVVVALAVSSLSLLNAQAPAGQPGGAPDHVAALKQNLTQGQAAIRKYEWVETTAISMKGEEKSRKMNRAYYGADGKVQKVPMGQPAQAQQDSGGRGGGRRGGRVVERIVENKVDEITDYMERAVNLIQSYVPPDPARIQSAKDGGKVVVEPQAAGRVRIVISDYRLPGDRLTVDLDAAANRLVGLGVNTYLDEKDEVVTLAVQLNTLPDGAFYPAQTTLDAKAKEIRVVVQNSGHKPMTQ